MSTDKAKRKHKWWNNGWIGLVLLLIVFSILFLIGMFSPTYEPNPVIDGRPLSDWTEDLDSAGINNSKHDMAVSALVSHRDEVTPVLIEWLQEKDTFPQSVYFTTMSLLEGKSGKLLNYRGAYFNQLHAARALKYIGNSSPEVIEALRGVVKQYKGTRHYAGEVATDSLKNLEN